MSTQLQDIENAIHSMQKSLSSGELEPAYEHYQSIASIVAMSPDSPALVFYQIRCGAELIAALAESGDLPLVREIYEGLKSGVTLHMADPMIRRMALALGFNAMYAYLQGADLTRACSVFEDLSAMGRRFVSDSDVRVGWTAAASNLVSALAQNGQVDRAIEIFHELLRTDTAAAYSPRFGEELAHVALLLINGIEDRADHLDDALGVLGEAQGLTRKYPEDVPLRNTLFQCSVSLIAPSIRAGRREEAARILETLKAACDIDRDDAELQSIFLKTIGNAVIAFANADLVQAATSSYTMLESVSDLAELGSELANVRCVAGLYLFVMLVRQKQNEAAVRVFLEGSAAIKGDENEDTLRKNEGAMLVDVAKNAAGDSLLEVYEALIRAAESDRSERRLREVLAIGALGCMTSQSLSEKGRDSLYQMALRMAEAFPAEPNLLQSAMLMADLNGMFSLRGGAPQQ